MRPWLVGLAMLIPAAANADGDTPAADIAAQAEHAFRQGLESKTRLLEARKHFAKAADLCLELHDRGLRSPALYRNLGNAAVLADRWPEALWAYHVGLKLDPNDRELRDHLAFVRGKVLYPPAGKGQPEPDDWPTAINRPTPLELTALAATAYVLTWLAAAFAFFRRTARLYLATALLALVTVVLGIVVWHALQQADLDRRTPLVIVADNTPLYRGNGASYPANADVPMLPRGMEVRQQHRRGAWLQVRLTSGEVGWLPRNRVLVVEP